MPSFPIPATASTLGSTAGKHTRPALLPAAAKHAIRAAAETPGPDGIRVERALFLDLFGTGDQREGMRAFLEKREPRFGGPGT